MQFKPTVIAAAVAMAFFNASTYAQSVSSRITGTITSNGAIGAQADSVVDGNPIQGSQYTGGLFFADSRFYGDLDTGTTVVRVLAGKNQSVSSVLEYTATVTNNSDSALDLGFTFFIGRGRIGVDQYSYGNAFQGIASLDASISWGGTPLWAVYLEMKTDGVADGNGGIQTTSTPTITRSAAAQDFGVSDGGSNLYYDPYAGSLGLGLLAAHESKTLTYRIEGEGYYTTDADMDMYGYGGQAVVGNTDPFDFSGRPVDELGNPLPGGIQPVPEPETYALFSLGLVALGVAAHRRRRSKPTRSS